jgi:ribosomal protein S18 acetylase RimI-like enzyme
MIRRAKVADANAVHTVMLTGQDAIPLAKNFADAEHQDWVREQCRDRRVWVFQRDTVVIGVSVIGCFNDPAEISYIVTLPKFQRIGVASALLDDAKDRIWRRWKKTAIGKVKEGNVAIIQLLEKHGFVVDHDLYVRPGWIMYRAQPPK